jgi:hypothetical protein
VAGFCEHCNEPLGFTEGSKSRVAERLSSSEEWFRLVSSGGLS